MIRRFAFLLVLAPFSFAGCIQNSSDEDLKVLASETQDFNYGMRCDDPGSLFPPYHCLTSPEGSMGIFDYSNFDLQTTWTNNADRCFSLCSDGTGTYRIKAANGTVRSFPIRWGTLVSNTGGPVYFNDYLSYLYLESDQLTKEQALLHYAYYSNEILTQNFRQGSCSF